MTVSGVIDGVHTIEARAVDPVTGPDTTPWTIVAIVNRSPPLVTIVRKPSETSNVPSTHANFLLVSSSQFSTSFVGALFVLNASDGGGGNHSNPMTTWTRVGDVATNRSTVQFSGLMPGRTYRFDVSGVDTMQNVGPVASWSWSSAACPTGGGNVALTNIVSYPVAFGERAFGWDGVAEPALTLGVDYALDDGNWCRKRRWSCRKVVVSVARSAARQF